MTDKEVNSNVPVVGGLTPNEIQKLKRVHKTNEVYFIAVTPTPKDGVVADELHFWFKKIDMVVFSAAAKYIETDPVKATQIIIENTLIKGDKSATNDVDVFSALSPKLMGAIGTATATLKKF